MSTDRRFTDDEVAHILERASRPPGDDTNAAPADSAMALERGLSLAQLQAIAAEAGIDVGAVTREATAVARGDLVPTAVRHATGAPIALARTIEFGREVDERTWARMVVVLQDTFAARGRLRSDGALREWSNGNLRAVLEPTPHGHRLHLSTRKGTADALRIFGNVAMAGGVVAGATMLAVNAVQGAPPPAGLPLLAALIPTFVGLGARLQDVLSRRAWARERVAQLDELPAQLRVLLPSANDVLAVHDTYDASRVT